MAEETAPDPAGEREPAPLWEPKPKPEAAAAALERAGFPPWQAACLARRGVADADQADAFLNPSADQLTEPAALPGVAEAAERLQAARAAGQRVALVGDYDVDGVSAVALLSAVLGACGLELETILPHRMREGYGFQPVHVERATEAGCALVVTADCGSSSVAAAEATAAAGLDLIVTDHHLSTDELPAGVIEINPKRRAGAPGSDELCAAGIVLKLALEVARRSDRPVPVEALLRIACLGTIADMVPLSGENRVIAAVGLDSLPDTPSRGLRALMARARVVPPVTAADIGYRIGPRLNAAGRMGDADPALELLLTRDPARAAALADQLEERNRVRQEEQRRVEDEAREQIESRAERSPVLVAWAEGWHRGVVGIAAGRLAREFHRPTILFSLDDETASGSGRSISGVGLFEFLLPWRDRLVRFGGHAQAIGLTAERSGLETLRTEWVQAAALWPADRLRRRLEYELELPAAEVTPELVRRVDRLGPFGVGNPRPLARVGPLRLCAPPRTFGRGHLSLRAEAPDGSEVALLGWSWEERRAVFERPFEVLAVPIYDRYRACPALRLTDARPTDRAGA